MTEKSRAFLCVGGPWDGKRYASTELGFKVVHTPRPTAITWNRGELIAPVSINYTHYVAHRLWASKDGEEVWVWQPFEQKHEDTLRKLLERYEQSANIQWS